MPDLVAFILVVAGLYLILAGPNQPVPTVIQIEGQQITTSSVGLALVALAVITLVTNGNFGSVGTFSAQRLKSQFLNACIVIIIGAEAGTLLYTRSEIYGLMVFICIMIVLVLIGRFVLPKMLKIDSALEADERRSSHPR